MIDKQSEKKSEIHLRINSYAYPRRTQNRPTSFALQPTLTKLWLASLATAVRSPLIHEQTR